LPLFIASTRHANHSLPSFPTRRSSDLQLTFRIRRRQLPEQVPPTWQVREVDRHLLEVSVPPGELEVLLPESRPAQVRAAGQLPRDRKSTRLNSSHVSISYAHIFLYITR